MRFPQILLLRNLTCLALMGALVSACLRTPAPQIEVIAPDADAYALLAEDRYPEAAAAFNELALAVESPLTEEYQLLAADALLIVGDRVAARAIAMSVPVPGLSAPLQAHRNLILASIESVESNPMKVLEWLAANSIRPQGNRQLSRYHGLRASAFEQLGQYLTAARERAVADDFIPVGGREANRKALWVSLARAPESQLTSIDTSSPDSFKGWVTLALIARRLITDPAVFEEAVTQWALSFPVHPANNIVDSLKDASLVGAHPPKHVALLLPLDGPFAAAATAIRDGFLAAWYQSAYTMERPRISLLNTAERDILEVYAEAVAAGADFVVGPLDKPSVTKLAQTTPLLLNTLALNQADHLLLAAGELASVDDGGVATSDTTDEQPEPTGILYQFSLSPEEEAQRVAERAWSEGHASAAIIAPIGNWGQRISTAFTESWEELGGSIAGWNSYESNAKDMTEPVSTLLGVDRSKERAKTLTQFLGADLKHTPRRRKDLEFIFMVANPKQARLLRPQFRFHHASRVPVYSTSHVYAGRPNSSVDIDIDGVVFGDMPWVLRPGGTNGTLRISSESAWQERFNKYIRFYAFGADAYLLLPHLGILRAQPFIELPSETGLLSVNADNLIRRGLSWAQFVDGVPIQLEPATLEEE